MSLSQTYHSEDYKRKSVLYEDEKGFRVALMEEGNVVEERTLYDHSKYYAEDLAENWVMYVGEFKA